MTEAEWMELRNLCALAQRESTMEDRSLFYGVLDTTREYAIRKIAQARGIEQPVYKWPK